MTAIDEKLAELFHERAAAARPEPDLPAVLEGAERVRVVAGQTRLPVPRYRMLGIAAAVIVGAAGVVAVEWHRASKISPGLDRPQITYPDQLPAAPLTAPSSAPSFLTLATTPDGTGLVVRENTHTEPLSGAEATTPEASPWKTWPIGGQTVTDIDSTTPAGFYVATCCAPGGTIWRNGPENTKGTRIDYVLDGLLRATVDPATSTARVGDVVVDEPGVLDVSVLDRRSAVFLVDEPAPHLIVLSSDDFTATAHPDRRTIELPTGPHKPCGIVALEQGILVLAGGPVGIDPCVSDRAFIVDPETGAVITTIRLPASVKAINSDHIAHVIAVTVDGNVVIGQFGPPATEPLWSTVLEGDYLAAYLRT